MLRGGELGHRASDGDRVHGHFPRFAAQAQLEAVGEEGTHHRAEIFRRCGRRRSRRDVIAFESDPVRSSELVPAKVPRPLDAIAQVRLPDSQAGGCRDDAAAGAFLSRRFDAPTHRRGIERERLRGEDGRPDRNSGPHCGLDASRRSEVPEFVASQFRILLIEVRPLAAAMPSFASFPSHCSRNVRAGRSAQSGRRPVGSEAKPELCAAAPQWWASDANVPSAA